MEIKQPSAAARSARTALAKLLADCVNLGASDIHLTAGDPPYFRHHGKLEAPPDGTPLDDDILWDIARELVGECRFARLDETGSLDAATNAADGSRFRINIYKQGGRPALALRLLDDQFRPLSELGLPEALYDLCTLRDGLILVAGPTGAGKSTTLATLLDRINQTRDGHLITIEDPVEYLHTSRRMLVHQRQIGSDATSFYDALVASLRQDPDVILVGEIRDLNTIRTAITAAETGHLVFTTVHAGDCVGVIERLVSVFPADEQAGIRRQLAMTIRAIVAQHLIRVDGPAASRSNSEGKGRRSRVIVSEVLRVTPAVANLIANGKSAQIYSSMETGASAGMQTMAEDLARLWREGLLSETTVMNLVKNPAVLRKRMERSPTHSGGRE